MAAAAAAAAAAVAAAAAAAVLLAAVAAAAAAGLVKAADLVIWAGTLVDFDSIHTGRHISKGTPEQRNKHIGPCFTGLHTQTVQRNALPCFAMLLGLWLAALQRVTLCFVTHGILNLLCLCVFLRYECVSCSRSC